MWNFAAVLGAQHSETTIHIEVVISSRSDGFQMCSLPRPPPRFQRVPPQGPQRAPPEGPAAGPAASKLAGAFKSVKASTALGLAMARSKPPDAERKTVARGQRAKSCRGFDA